MNLRFIIFFIFTSFYFLPLQAQELGNSEEAYYPSPVIVSPRPRTKPPAPKRATLSPETSARPLIKPGPLKELTAIQAASLKSLACPGGEFCPGPFQNFKKDGQFFNPLCSEFITEQGEYGETGIMMLEAMGQVQSTNQKNPYKSAYKNCDFRKNFDFGRACPNFKYLSPLQKDHVWVWLWASVSQAESSCDPAVDAEGIDNLELGRKNIADGLFGLEYSEDTRKVNDRDPRFCPHREEPEEFGGTKNLYFQSRCAASIMFNRQCGKSVVNSGSYWEQLLTNQRKVFELMQRHPLCKTAR